VDNEYILFRTSIISHVFFAAVIWLGLVSSAAADPTAHSQCNQITDYKVATPNLTLLYCADGIPPDPKSMNLAIYELTATAVQALPFEIAVDRFSSDDTSWIVLKLTPNAAGAPSGMQGGKKYRLVRMPAGKDDKPVDIDTSSSAGWALNPQDTNDTKFILKSKVAFQEPSPGSLKLALHEFVGEDRQLTFTYPNNGFLSPNATLDMIKDPGDLGRIDVILDDGITDQQQVSLTLKGLVDIFGENVKVDTSSRVKLAQAPSTREAANFYFKLDYAAGVGAKPAWVFDGKVSPPIGSPIGGWQVAPDLEADIGNNSISGIKYTDTVHLGVTASRGKGLSGPLQYVLATVGPTYETDKELDRHNMLATLDFAFDFKNLYEPRKYRTIDKFTRAKADPGNATVKIQPEDIKPALFGYGVDFHTGVEGGGALVDTTQKATTGTAKIDVPTYSIARPYTQVHAFFEIGQITFDVKSVGRYLAETENTVRQLTNNTLLLIPTNGWHGYLEGNVTWTLDPTGHFAANIVYKNGFSPPTFSRVNTVQAGLLIKF
jgi:hypothetical protein